MGKNITTYSLKVGLAEIMELAMLGADASSYSNDFLPAKDQPSTLGLDVSQIAPK